ncbi:MAG: glutamate--tRNA ligase [Deinococcales bacterium]
MKTTQNPTAQNAATNPAINPVSPVGPVKNQPSAQEGDLTQQIVTRIAPSPTGDPHVGTAYQSLFDYVAARQAGGRFIFRLEDTDQNRYNPESEAKLLEMLDWLGLSPDESPLKDGPHGPYRQSQRLDIYKRHAEELLAEGQAYRAFESAEELEEIRKDLQRRGLSYGYDGRARSLSAEESEARAKAGENFVIRFKSPQKGETIIQDVLRGPISVPNQEVQDVVLLKSDGFPTYHLAVVVDDHLMGVSHVIRGEVDSYRTNSRFALSGFWLAEPKWVHMPLLRNTSLKKLSKRHDDTSVASYRQQGIVAEALLNYLGTMGWSMPDGREFLALRR